MAVAALRIYSGRMPEHLFTMVCDFAGGTYVSQVRARDERHAAREWAALLTRERPMGDASLDIASATIADLDESHGQPVQLEGLVGAWAITPTVGGGLALTNIIRSA